MEFTNCGCTWAESVVHVTVSCCGMRSGVERRAGVVVSALLSASALVGCSEDGPDGSDGDCSARVRLSGKVFRPHNELNQEAPGGHVLGRGEIIDCGSATDAQGVDTVEVYAVSHVDDEIAVVVTDSQWSGVYVVEGLPQSDWPEQLKIGR
jgi:hypothetical protein